jgi:RNA polymerase sigma factor (sigma-70 family)
MSPPQGGFPRQTLCRLKQLTPITPDGGVIVPLEAASLDGLSDRQLVVTLKQAVGREQWDARNDVITEFYNRYGGNLAATWLRRTSDSEATQEVLQETFTRAIAKLHTIGDGQDVLIWLRTTARNHWLDRKRREQVEERHEQAPPPVARGASAGAEERLIAGLDRSKTRSVFEQYLNQLDPQDREILALRLRGAQMPEICSQLRITDKECRRAYARIRFLLQKMRLRGFSLTVSDLLAGVEGEAEGPEGF